MPDDAPPLGTHLRGRDERRADAEPDECCRVEADVVVDVEFERGLLFLSVVNLGDRPAHRVRVRFTPAFRGGGGAHKTSRAALFRRLEFLAPRKRIPMFLDRAALYFARGEPTTIDVGVTWLDDAGTRRRRKLRHDLEIYRDLTYVEREVPRAGPP